MSRYVHVMLKLNNPTRHDWFEDEGTSIELEFPAEEACPDQPLTVSVSPEVYEQISVDEGAPLPQTLTAELLRRLAEAREEYVSAKRDVQDPHDAYLIAEAQTMRNIAAILEDPDLTLDYIRSMAPSWRWGDFDADLWS